MGSVATKTKKHKSDGYSREAHYAGSWYSSSSRDLQAQLVGFLQAVDDDTTSSAATSTTTSLRAVICPHAGYSYSGPTAAWSYHALQHELSKSDCPVRSILVLHPSHHVYLPGCAVSGATVLETPLGNLEVDQDLRDEILQLASDSGSSSSSTSSFQVMEKAVDEHEHSGEMQYPFIKQSLPEGSTTTIKVLPIMCGSLSTSQERDFGKLLAPILARSNVLTIISTDFCHWGSRFQYQPTSSSSSSTTTTNNVKIYEHIYDLDHQGMTHIELQEPGAFAAYLKQTKNTICGRHAIGVWLHAVQHNSQGKEVLDISFVKYAQSSQAQSMRESSVSYASAVARLKTT
jgi:AmmeMemoRadiSam system protein B